MSSNRINFPLENVFGVFFFSSRERKLGNKIGFFVSGFLPYRRISQFSVPFVEQNMCKWTTHVKAVYIAQTLRSSEFITHGNRFVLCDELLFPFWGSSVPSAISRRLFDASSIDVNHWQRGKWLLKWYSFEWNGFLTKCVKHNDRRLLSGQSEGGLTLKFDHY